MEQLRKYISENGINALADTDKLTQYLVEKDTNITDAIQIAIIIKLGNISEYLNHCNKTLSSVEVNNVIICCETATGLKKEIVKKHLYNIFMAAGVDCSYKQLFIAKDSNVNYIKSKINIRSTPNLLNVVDVSYCSSEQVDKEFQLASNYIKSGRVDKAMEIYQTLAKSGSTEAMYILGMSYLEGKGVLRSVENGMSLIKTAAENGNPHAKAKLGDYYYEKNDYEAAYQMYTAPGVVAVNPNFTGENWEIREKREKLAAIINSQKSNKNYIIVGAILVALMWIFLFIFKGNSDIRILFTIIPTIIYSCICYLYSKCHFDIKKIPILFGIMLAVYALCPILLLLN